MHQATGDPFSLSACKLRQKRQRACLFSQRAASVLVLPRSCGLSAEGARRGIKGEHVYEGWWEAPCLGNSDGIILEQLIYLAVTKKPAGDPFVLWQGQ